MAKRIKHEAARTPSTQKLLISIGQMTHNLTSRMTVWSMGYKVKSIGPLVEEEALAKGSDFLGESVIFLVAGGIVVLEYNKSKAESREKEAKKYAATMAADAALNAKLDSLDLRLQALEEVLHNNRSRLMVLEEERYVNPLKQGESQEKVNTQPALKNLRRWWWPFR
mmetsp:Transcript_12824/g.28293  ORF Transcript_12824/g.28293 Transcript_12824/m.28293 type:complete len:167 (-) Transcript_12824:610-1110(-)|eukprot:CAMPEP_0113320116 /NCGR_PEP_ID=MMETSP0010_2-20120614/14042_1 /TAXON_ID=216773 ORGANISM="Corethron hystrix, Strain 308" /NCGR_SAMPLE_ID=MMETSP0010_2 /ASSEMBLY_ACC=CAM_ASM_000155 /LENGTH=166 /DNA_ID=CAMNT_0000177811 /DNA_START=293 /DNA_END=793 /DNA_ORIENTATION=+ /assembly_acc=CAM_ASM_000155